MPHSRALVIGGTRNLGPALVQKLLDRGDQVTLLHRGKTNYPFPSQVEELFADRSQPDQFAAALARRNFDLVVDTTLYTGADATTTAQLLQGRIGRYLFLSTGQVYLVRDGLQRPFREEDYAGATIPAPPLAQRHDYENWLYGMDKRAAEDALFRAAATGFPLTVLRLPGVNSERDHHDRILNYLARLQDGGPILVPASTADVPHLPLRHVYGEDVVDALLLAAQSPAAAGRAYNISQEETATIEAFLTLLARIAQRPLQSVKVPRAILEAAGLLPSCSPFSSQWMSALDNTRSRAELGMSYTPLQQYLERIVHHFASVPSRTPPGYEQRAAELQLAPNWQPVSANHL
jgi:nucleoside-diphosphate-sugar epimerase